MHAAQRCQPFGILLNIAGLIEYIIIKDAFLFLRRPSADYTRTNTTVNKICTAAMRNRNVIRRDRCAREAVPTTPGVAPASGKTTERDERSCEEYYEG
jgi:hypothetical protein